MSEVAVIGKNHGIQAAHEIKVTREMIDTWKAMYCKGASDAEMAQYIRTCNRTGLSPESRHIFIVPRWSSVEGKNTFTPQVSIDGFRLIAQRTGVYGGQLGPMWCGEDEIWKDVWLKNEHPMAAKVGVIRKDWTEALWVVATWQQYVQTGKGGSVNPMWQKMGALMLAKCAESLALRKAFPAEMGGLYTPDEMGQADNKPAQVYQARPAAAQVQPKPIDKLERIEKMMVAFGQLYTKQTGQDAGAIRYFIEDLCGGKNVEEFDETDFKALQAMYSDLIAGKKTWEEIMPKSETIEAEEFSVDPDEDKDLTNM